jgi:hypothetical protein
MDICISILPLYADVINVRSNNDGNRSPAFDGGNIDGGVANFNNGVRCMCGITGGGGGGGSSKRRRRGTSWGEQPLACFIPHIKY